jgi:hypothetical protein
MKLRKISRTKDINSTITLTLDIRVGSEGAHVDIFELGDNLRALLDYNM